MRLSVPTRSGMVLAIAVAAAACSDDATVDASETQLEESYLEPLSEAGLRYEVTDVCHYRRQDEDEARHFQIDIAVEADPARVADALDDSVDVIDRDRGGEPMIVQQFLGEPGRRWDGSIGTADGLTTLGLVKNNVTVSGDRPNAGWLRVCDFAG